MGSVFGIHNEEEEEEEEQQKEEEETVVVVDTWDSVRVQLDKFISINMRAPAIKSSSTEERQLAKWVKRQQKDCEHANLTPEQLILWNNLVNKYQMHLDPVYRWKMICSSVSDFVHEHKRAPVPTAIDEHEKTLGRWLSVQDVSTLELPNEQEMQWSQLMDTIERTGSESIY